MDNAFLEYFKSFTFLNLEDLRVLYSLVKLKSVDKGEILSKSGQISYEVFFVLKGLLRTYTITSQGEEITLAFALKGMEAASPASIFEGKPTIAFIEAIEPSVVVVLDARKFEEIAIKHPRLVLMQNQSLKRGIVQLSERIEFYTVLSPEERFLYIQKNLPELIQRVPQKYLASYIGITTVSLSRIKARIANRKK